MTQQQEDEWDNHEISIKPAPGTCCPEKNVHAICLGCDHDYGSISTLLAKREKEVKEEIIKIVDIEIEAWFGAHDEMGKTFMSEDMIKHIKKRMEDYDNGSSTI